MRTFLLLAIALLPQEPADPTLEQILERMEKAAAVARGSIFVATTQKGPRFEPGLYDAEISVAKDGTVRIQDPPEAELRKPRLWTRTTSVVLADDSVYVTVDQLAEFPTPSRQSGMRKSTQRILKADCDRIDPFTEKWGSGAYYTWFWHLYFYALSPARAFTFERNLEFKGRRKLGDTECYLLQSDRPLDYGYSYESGGRTVESGYVGQRRRFFISASDYRLMRFDDIRRSPGDYASPPVTSVIDAYEGGIPTRAFIGFGNNLAGWKVRPTEAKEIRRGLDLTGTALIPESGDLFATKVRVGDLAARLEKWPDDPDLLYSSAIYGSNARMSQPQEAKPFIEKLDKIVAKSWTPTPVRNLLAILTDAEDRERLAPLLDRINKDPAMMKSAAPQVVRALIRLGDFDKAGALLDGLKDPESTGLWWAKTDLLLRKGDAAGAVSEFLKWPPEPPDQSSYGAPHRAFDFERLVKTIQRQTPELTTESVINALDAAVAKDPKSPRLHLARMTMLRLLADPARTTTGAGEALAACDDTWVNYMACSAISSMVRSDSEIKADPDKVQGALESMLKALESGTGRPCVAATKGAVLMKAGRREEALKEFRNELDVLEKAGPKFASNAMWVTESVKDLKEDALLERACRVHLGLYRKGEEQFRGFEWSHATNPLATLIRICAESGRYAEIYGAMKGMNLQRGFGCFWDPPVKALVPDLGAGLKAAALEDKDPAGIRWFAMMVVQSETAQVAGMLALDAAEWLDRARAVDPEDLEVLQALAEAYAKKGEADSALKTVDEMRKAIKTGAKSRALWSPEELVVFAAEQHLKNKDPKAAKAEILSLDLNVEYAPWTGWQMADVLEEVGEFDRAAAAIRRCEEFGHKPAYRLALSYVKRSDWLEAMRWANRAIESGYTPCIFRPGNYRYSDPAFMTRVAADKQEPPRTLRDDIRAKAGERFFIDRLMATKLPAMTPEETARAEKALRMIEEGNIPEREEALKVFRSLGPKSAPVLIKLMKEEESIWRTAARGLLQEWAEPR